jgi:uncharacterized protein DUF402
MSWASGDEIVVRYIRDGVVRGARPLTVVGERNGYLAAWLPEGTITATPTLADGSPIRSVPIEERFGAERSIRLMPWGPEGILKLFPQDGAHSVWVFYGDGVTTARGWYVNLEQRHRWWSGGLDTRDHVLDLWCERPREWAWKDEDELEAALTAGVLTRELGREIRAEGERVVGLIEAWAPPFCDGWESFEPDPAWSPPSLPAGWDTV